MAEQQGKAGMLGQNSEVTWSRLILSWENWRNGYFVRSYLQHVPGSLSTAVVTLPFNFLFFSLGLPAETGELTYDGSALAEPKNKARRLQAGTAGT